MKQFYDDIRSALEHVEVVNGAEGAVLGYLRMVKATSGPNGARIIFIGNGGSQSIASHMAADYQKNGDMPTMCFSDPSMLTCVSNDMGYGSVYRHQLSKHGRLGDVMFAISSSGNSVNIVNAVNLARDLRMNVVTLSGFQPDNQIRQLGHVNFYVPSVNYGVVEIAHLSILHGFLNEVIK